jgi:hypothetical protein
VPLAYSEMAKAKRILRRHEVDSVVRVQARWYFRKVSADNKVEPTTLQ